ncbi:MAG: diguanylate cyclase [Betaproteobacteria bacterium]|nr:diguanylate cyclase [Betaproteobacteria bacterium]
MTHKESAGQVAALGHALARLRESETRYRTVTATAIDELLANAVSVVAEGLNADCCRLLRVAPDGRRWMLEAGAGWDEGWSGREWFESETDTQLEYLLQQPAPLLVEDYAAETRFAGPAMLAAHGIRSGLEVLIGRSGAPWGILGGFSRRPGVFSPESVNFLQGIADTLGAALERAHAEERLAWLAQYDTLTGLPNRDLFHERLGQSLVTAERDGCQLGILYIDLDGFKNVNDAHGHNAGDELLRLVARRLEACVREGDTVGRLGGDEFAIVIGNLATADDAELVAEQVVAQLAQPFDLDGRETLITASIGISIYPGDGTDASLLLKNADTAMYQGKEQGMLAAAEFIGVAEESGLIVQIGEWVFETACRQTMEWQRAGYPDLFVTVNVSPVEIRRGKVVQHAQRALERSGLAPCHLEIELTESVGVDDAEAYTNTLAELRGARNRSPSTIFGTGYSSLSSLKDFPISKVKIDQTFTRDIVFNPDDAAIVQAVIAMAHHLQLEVVSKGVESERQAGFLRRCRCDIAQGFLFGAPMQAADFKELLDVSAGRLLPVRSSLTGPAPAFPLAAVA